MKIGELIENIIAIGRTTMGFNGLLFDYPISVSIDGIKSPLEVIEIDLQGGVIVLHGKEI